MLALTGANRYYFVEGVTDMRLGQYRLCNVVETQLHRNPYNGDTFIFMSKDRRKTKIVRYEYALGVWLSSKSEVCQLSY